MLLVCGPPGSGKTHHVLKEVRNLLAAGQRDFRLLVPTATMAEHLRHQLARDGYVFSPELISTLSRYLGTIPGGPAQAPQGAVALATETVLSRQTPAAFARVAALPGLAGTVTQLIEELSASGCTAEDLRRATPPSAVLVAALAEVYQAVSEELQKRGWLPRGESLMATAGQIASRNTTGPSQIFLDGFLSLTGPELRIVGALASHSQVTVTLPAWRGAAAARDHLLSAGFREIELAEPVRSKPREVIVEARSIAQEAGEIARRVLIEHSQGRSWREMGVIVRSAGTHAAALATCFERFGIPARFYFAEPLATHGTIRCIAGVVEAMLAGWDVELLCRCLSLPESGIGGSAEGDRLEVALRELQPAAGLLAVRPLLNGPAGASLYEKLRVLDSWRDLRAVPKEWAARARTLRSLIEPPFPVEPFTRTATRLARSAAEALAAFGHAVDEAANLGGDSEAIPFSEYWRIVEAVLRTTALRVTDRRRDVVHVIDAFEARQWELAVVFVCGLLEREFPRYHPQNPILNDEVRRELSRSGIRLRTSEEWQDEERFLFEIAASRATAQLVLTYPRYNEKGEENLRSFFVDEFVKRETAKVEPARDVLPKPTRSARLIGSPRIADEALCETIRARHSHFTPTSIESFLQCPFQFFAGKTLCLAPAPPRPGERLDTLLQGTILHEVLAELAQQPGQPLDVLARVFGRLCDENRVPHGYRREAVMLELERNLLLFPGEPGLLPDWPGEVEQKFELELAGDVIIRGRVDRILSEPGTGYALVVDYKYSSAERVRKNVRAHHEGRRVQGGLYMLAARQCFGREPAGMVYFGLRGEAALRGWHIGIDALPRTVTACVPDELREVIESAVRRTLESASRIREGEIQPLPADREKCEYCDFRDVCRVESAPARIIAAGGWDQ